MNIETADDQPTRGPMTPAMAPIVDPGYVPPASRARADETTVPVAEVQDIVQEDEDDYVESALDAVEDIRSVSVVTNHFRI